MKNPNLNNMDIDTMSAELTKELAATTSLEKSLPPKLLYRFRKWLKSFASQVPVQRRDAVVKAIADSFGEIMGAKSLKKNEALASFYDSGIVKMDFGPEVDPKIKKAAIDWAKRRGLKIVEAPLGKSADSYAHYVFAPQAAAQPQTDLCVKRIKFTV